MRPNAVTTLRPIQEILDHADELAGRFEEYEPGEADERSVEEYLPAKWLSRPQSAHQKVVVEPFKSVFSTELVACMADHL